MLAFSARLIAATRNVGPYVGIGLATPNLVNRLTRQAILHSDLSVAYGRLQDQNDVLLR